MILTNERLKSMPVLNDVVNVIKLGPSRILCKC